MRGGKESSGLGGVYEGEEEGVAIGLLGGKGRELVNYVSPVIKGLRVRQAEDILYEQFLVVRKIFGSIAGRQESDGH